MQLAYAEVGGRGDRSPLVLLHGLFGNHGNFQAVARALVRRGSGKVRPWGRVEAAAPRGGWSRAGSAWGWGDTVPLPRQVLTLDARNHGGSPHSPLMTYEAMSLDVQHLLTHLGITKCILLGHSMGGKTAMTLALQRVGRRRAPGGWWGGLVGGRVLLEREAVGGGWHLWGLFTGVSLAHSPTGAGFSPPWSGVLSRSEL